MRHLLHSIQHPVHRIRRALILSVLFAVPLTAADKPADKSVDLPAGKPLLLSGSKAIFDGKTLEGWKAIGDAKWTVADKAIAGRTGGGGYGWLIYEKPVADFILEFECKWEDHGNSGIQFRSHVLGEGEMCGYQAEFDPDNEKVGCTGGIYEEGPDGRAWLYKPDCEKIKTIQKPRGEWNDYKIQAIGDHLQTWLNGEKITDLHDHQARSGIIALQVHSGKKPVHVSFRKMKLTDLGDGGGWKPLFDGKSLQGWHTQGEENVWIVEDAQIVGELVKPSPYAYLATDKNYGDFELKIDMKFDSDQGNSGVFFRCTFPPQCTRCNEVARNLPEDVADFKCPKPGCGGTQTKPMEDRVHIHGPQCEFAPAKDVGSPTAAVYDARGHGWINRDKVTDHMKQMNKEKEWNQLRLLARGNHIMTWLNGYLISDITGYEFPKQGIIALQMHETKQAIKVRFRNVEIRPISR